MGQLEPLGRTITSRMHEVCVVPLEHRTKLGTGNRESRTKMNRRLLIQQILETWINQLPTETQTGASIATKEDIARLSEHLAAQLQDVDQHETGHWLSMLVELYTQAKFRNETRFDQSNNPSIHSSIVQ